MRLLPLLTLFALSLLAMPSPGSSQGIAQLMTGFREGGGWVSIPIEEGRGTFSTITLPTAAMSVAGCINVWSVHSGTWKIEAHEKVLGSVLSLDAEPGQGVPFEHDFGMTAQVDFAFRWSEPRDTTLYLWVGLGRSGRGPETACEPREPG
jgi:hypothetical protein